MSRNPDNVKGPYYRLPNLVLAIEDIYARLGTLRILKPISSEAVSIILGTRYLHSTENHTRCPTFRFHSGLPNPSESHDEHDRGICKIRSRKRAIDCIGKICLWGGHVYNIGEAATNGKISHQLRLQNTRIDGYSGTGQGQGDPQMVGTIIEVLKLAVMPLGMTNDDAPSGGPPAYNCNYASPVYPWHLDLNLQHNQVKAFCGQVRSLVHVQSGPTVSVVSRRRLLGSQLELQARSTPSILLNRIRINVTGLTEKGFARSVIEQMQSVYEKSLASARSALPKFACGPAIFQCASTNDIRTRLFGESETSQLCFAEEGGKISVRCKHTSVD